MIFLSGACLAFRPTVLQLIPGIRSATTLYSTALRHFGLRWALVTVNAVTEYLLNFLLKVPKMKKFKKLQPIVCKIFEN